MRRALDNLRQASGVRSVAMAEGMPVDFDERDFRVASTAGAKFVTAQVTRVGENFLETIGAQLLRGRTITAEDRLMAAPVAVISEPLARQLFPATEADWPARDDHDGRGREQEFTVVGVTADFATSQLTTERPQILLPLPTVHRAARWTPTDGVSDRARRARRRTEVEERPGNRAPRAGRRGVARRGVPRHRHRTGPRRQELRRFGCGGTAVGVAGGLVLVLAALGIVGVVGFMVATRTRELAVRMALGATRFACLA